MAIRMPCDKCNCTGRITDYDNEGKPLRPKICNKCDGLGFKLAKR